MPLTPGNKCSRPVRPALPELSPEIKEPLDPLVAHSSHFGHAPPRSQRPMWRTRYAFRYVASVLSFIPSFYIHIYCLSEAHSTPRSCRPRLIPGKYTPVPHTRNPNLQYVNHTVHAQP
ncbi:hypothetical protein PAXRUDRAFT_9537 [Paxillus rubicundulus Ve08.2h10]|uniref:Uncharacterized protein n=1 Tax=Paxillus rubicundulus Ve08.2h10 TaxID=930991 RepID=A0A0D0EBY9_9AGAM|nr:hypothetical protein PAXRUDRAFT_9537 [Paxillus rubicundulus Ve08.2h10]